MFQNLTSLALGLIVFSVILGVGIIVLTNFSASVAVCSADKTFNITQNTCTNATGSANPTNTPWTTLYYLEGSNGITGLSAWTPAIIALAVGLLFIGALMFKKSSY